MPNNLASFAIHVDDVDRARGFYEAVFGWEFEPWGPPGFYLIHTGTADDPGIQGLLHARSEPRTGGGLNGFEPTFAVADADAIAAAVERHGGKVTFPKAVIPPSAPWCASSTPRATTSGRCSTTRRRTPEPHPKR